MALLDGALTRLSATRDELRDLDAALGDGDLGITVSKGCEAVRARLGELRAAAPAEVLRTAGMAFASANPSTMAALVGGGVMAGAKAVGEAPSLGHDEVTRFAHAVVESISSRGKAQLGDKTMLDALAPSVEALETTGGDAKSMLTAMVERARRGVEETAPCQSRKGRAAWLGERSSGHPDPGATAYLRLLEALRAAVR